MPQFDVIIERDEDGLYVGSIPQLTGCHTQGHSLREAAELCLEVEGARGQSLEFAGIQLTIAR